MMMKLEQKLALLDSVRDKIECADGCIGYDEDGNLAHKEIAGAVALLEVLMDDVNSSITFQKEFMSKLDSFCDEDDCSEDDSCYEDCEDGDADEDEDCDEDEDELELEECDVCERCERYGRY
jgi:hypothetical protein